MALKDWRMRIGKPLVIRLEDELDAHAAFLMPRHFPGSAPFDAGVVPEAKPLKVDIKPQKRVAPKADGAPQNVDAAPPKADANPASAPSNPVVQP